ncbi:alpha/beta hydrolase [Arthrobacter sp. NPDC057013]|uniref:alpha/beta hydrolase n=1 Tax=Arthrobacter sp. NPDC057013 TaxID=3345999 RepID=UPI00363A84FF
MPETPPSAQQSVVFIHGLWLHASSWNPWLELFRARGYTASAPGWPGDADTVEGTRMNADALNDVGIEAIYRHYARQLAGMEAKPIAIGHSFGGLIAQELLANNLVAAAVVIDSAPIKGVTALPFSQLKSALPVLGNPANRKRAVSLTAEQFRYSFGNAIRQEESDRLHQQWTIPGPGRPLFQDATANFHRHSPAAVDTHYAVRGPLLLTSGTEDHTVPKVVTQQVLKMYAKNESSVTEHLEFAGRGHSLTIDGGWPEVAESILEWVARNAPTGSGKA